MPRPPRRVAAGVCYHVLNRGNGRMRLFHKDADYAAFIRVLAEGLGKYPVDVHAWCLMPNHWHLVLRPRNVTALAGLMRWVGVTHVRRHHEHYHTRGGGHLYQGRFKSFPIQRDDRHFLTVCRYVEANPRRAGLVERAERWPWSSLGHDPSGEQPAPRTASWPVDRPADWARVVNEPLSDEEVGRLRLSVTRGRPFGDERWTRRAAARLGLLSTLRPAGRPRKVNQ